MSYRLFTRSADRFHRLQVPLDRRDRPWLGGALLVGLVVAGLYLALNQYPAYGAGLYTLTADEIRAAGYGLPETIPHYTAEGVPFAYPPLAFYALAVLRDLGAGAFAAARFVPPLVVVLALVPAYLLGRDLLDGRPRGAAAAILVTVNPQVLEWHVSAGGLVRAPAFLLALSGAYAALRIFRDRDREWVAVGLPLFALVLLTHPTYALFVVVTYLVFWAGYDRSVPGLLDGAVVGVGGLVLTAPWWLTVASRFGFDVFTSAAGTHGGVGGGLFAALSGVSTWSLLVLAAGAVAVLGGWRVIGVWLLAAEFLFKQPRFAYTVGAFAFVGAAVVLVDRGSSWSPTVREHRRELAMVALVVVATAGVGAVGYEFDERTGDTTPAFVDDADVAAMEWAGTETSPDATFVVLGDAAEWFPVVADRTILLGPWGMEWREPATYERHLGTYVNASTCQSAGCVERWTASVEQEPDYLYVPKGHYTVRGFDQANFGTLDRSLAHRERYEPVFENEGVVVFRVRDVGDGGGGVGGSSATGNGDG
ncbi:glycosyltransferase family 39 protein [Halobacteria archaeon HArc-gm2]|nr:glycosyltransferase family 39 protein [Halobacteria archaeon HArc-gm2]